MASASLGTTGYVKSLPYTQAISLAIKWPGKTRSNRSILGKGNFMLDDHFYVSN